MEKRASNSGLVEKTLMDLWKASAGLYHYLLIAKRKADNFDKRSLNLVNVM